MCVFWVGLVCLVGEGPGSDVWEGCHRAGQTKAFPRVTPIRGSGPKWPDRQDGPKRCSSTRQAQ